MDRILMRANYEHQIDRRAYLDSLGGFMNFLIKASAISVLFCSGCNGYREPITEYGQGYNHGVHETRELIKDHPVLGGLAAPLAPLSSDSSKSADWNAGYRAGIKAELNKTYGD